MSRYSLQSLMFSWEAMTDPLVIGRRACVLFLVTLCLGACSSTNFGPLPAVNAPGPSAATGPYRIQPGDELEIRFFHTPEQNVVLPVRPDGYISLPLVYELRAAGSTVEELRQELVARCSAELADPEIAVILRTFSGYLVHVGGEVKSPGVLQLTGPRTVLEAVFEAGGFLPSAGTSDVVVVRRLEQGGYELLAANINELLVGEDARGNIVLRPYDVVYVPRSGVADVNKWVDQYIRKNIPIDFSYRLDVGN